MTLLTEYPLLSSDLKNELCNLVLLLKSREEATSFSIASEVLALFKRILESCSWENSRQCLEYVRGIGSILVSVNATELVIGNVLRRTLFIIREECMIGKKSTGISKVYNAKCDDQTAFHAIQTSLSEVLQGRGDAKQHVLDHGSGNISCLIMGIVHQLNELEMELETVLDDIAFQAKDHIPDGARILTLGNSSYVERFFCDAAVSKQGKCHFEVFLVESAPYCSGHEMAERLALTGIESTMISDAALYAVMPLIDIVILPTHAVMANGGLITPSGGHIVAQAACDHAVPVVCLTDLFKLSPKYPHDPDIFNELSGPNMVLEYKSAQIISNKNQVLNPNFDYIPPELLSLYVTNHGPYQPSYIYRLLAECYHPEDRIL